MADDVPGQVIAPPAMMPATRYYYDGNDDVEGGTRRRRRWMDLATQHLRDLFIFITWLFSLCLFHTHRAYRAVHDSVSPLFFLGVFLF